MSKHTPGPWETGGNDVCVDGRILFLGTGEDYSKRAADARLVAAAPELLEALDWLLHLAHGCSKGGQYCPVTDEEWTDAWGEAKAAIARAK